LAILFERIGPVIWDRSDLDHDQQAAVDADAVDLVRAATLVALLFGDNSATGKTANQIRDVVSDVVGSLRGVSDQDVAARELTVKEADKKLMGLAGAPEAFMRAVHSEIRPEFGK
jgi:hypothetical protein